MDEKDLKRLPNYILRKRQEPLDPRILELLKYNVYERGTKIQAVLIVHKYREGLITRAEALSEIHDLLDKVQRRKDYQIEYRLRKSHKSQKSPKQKGR